MVGDDEMKVRAERARAIGLFRYQLIREAADAVHSTKERGKLVREIASGEHIDPLGRRLRISRQTLDRWIRDWRVGGFDALVPNARQCTPRTPAEVLELARYLDSAYLLATAWVSAVQGRTSEARDITASAAEFARTARPAGP